MSNFKANTHATTIVLEKYNAISSEATPSVPS